MTGLVRGTQLSLAHGLSENRKEAFIRPMFYFLFSVVQVSNASVVDSREQQAASRSM